MKDATKIIISVVLILIVLFFNLILFILPFDMLKNELQDTKDALIYDIYLITYNINDNQTLEERCLSFIVLNNSLYFFKEYEQQFYFKVNDYINENCNEYNIDEVFNLK